MSIVHLSSSTTAASIARLRLSGELQAPRNIKSVRSGFRTVLFPSRKHNRCVICESRNEANFALILEQNSQVNSLVEQPFTVKLRVDKRLVKYTPDFFVDYATGPSEIFEVKPDSWVDSAMNVQKMGEAEDYFRRIGLKFRVVSTSEFGGTYFLENLKYIYPRIGFVTKRELITLFELIQRLGGVASVESVLNQSEAPKMPVILCWLFLYDYKQLHQSLLHRQMILNADPLSVKSCAGADSSALYWVV
jgi:hypothetical protein